MDKIAAPGYPLHITRSLLAAEKECARSGATTGCEAAVMRLAEAIIYYVGAVAVGQYSQALFTQGIEPDPTLSRSLRSLRRLLPGQWLGWASRGLRVVHDEQVVGLARWYSGEKGVDVTSAYEALRRAMVEYLAYTGEYGPRSAVSPRLLLELIDQFRIRRGKMPGDALPPDLQAEVSAALLSGLRAMLLNAAFLSEYPLYAPQQRRLLMGAKATTPMPPMTAPTDTTATILLYPPGEIPDYTKRPNLQAEQIPLFPLDPLLVYIHCDRCDRYLIAALKEVVANAPSYVGIDPDCGHGLAKGEM
ncbi:MAG: hypothetical protein IVW55_13825 [Chloroflexi bacterium]|nr:hypothetical protein [Chloroflexota bacterium]